MSSISETIRRLAEQRAGASSLHPGGSRLRAFKDFGSNPGALAATIHVPASVEAEPGLVVVLHGCMQSAAAYDHGSGWSHLADRHGFIVLFPEQTRQNNGNLCFNWFEPLDIRRGHGEAHSISQMVETACKRHSVDRKRVYVTGLSAGGAMANVMLATYPDVFSGGAVIAGLPYGVAASVPEAMERMRGSGLPASGMLSDKVIAAAGHKGPWPTVSVWHGAADHTVSQANARATVAQWCGVHDLDGARSRPVSSDGVHRIEQWTAPDGFAPIELHTIERMGHGTPIDSRDGLEHAAPFMLDVGISSTAWMARDWGLTPSFSNAQQPEAGIADPLPQRPRAEAAEGIQGIIEKALRSAGLMR